MTIKKSVWEADEIGREPVAADVRRLPDALARLRTQRLIKSVAEFRAALVALAVRADEIERLARDVIS